MFDMPSQAQIDRAIRQAELERSRFMLDCLRRTGQHIAAPFRQVLITRHS